MNLLQLPILGLSLCTILLSILLCINLDYKNKKQNNRAFIFVIICLIICCVGQLSSLLLSDLFNVSPIYFDYFVYIGTCFLPVAFLFFSLTFVNSKIQFKKYYLLVFVIPILSLLILWTNDFHHLFYVHYSTNTKDTIFGPYFYIHSIYTFLLFVISIVKLLRFSFKTSGFFSKQSIFIIIGSLIPIVLNLIGLLGFPMSIYLTPISFTFTVLFFALATFKFGFMKITPIALQKIVDIMSDGYIVLDSDNIITDFNKSFLNMFQFSSHEIRGKNFFSLVSNQEYVSSDDIELLKNYIKKIQDNNETIRIEREFTSLHKFFNIEITSIFSNTSSIGVLILFKDITQHMIDIQTIQNNQNMLMERERLASLGQLIGGIAHNLKTPIMSIAGAAEGLNDLVKEYDISIGDPDVNNDDHHAIAKDMRDWIDKIKNYTEYMSDVITAVKGQSVTLSEEQAVSFDVEELLKRVNILMRHELKNALINLNFLINVDTHTTLQGNINSLVQVINNMISNAIQAYNGETNKEIDLIVNLENNNLVISIKDYAGGLPKYVQDKLFKEMITTKGKNGTGLGLFMSYSTIRAHFNGNITFETQKGMGTKFNIILPR